MSSTIVLSEPSFPDNGFQPGYNFHADGVGFGSIQETFSMREKFNIDRGAFAMCQVPVVRVVFTDAGGTFEKPGCLKQWDEASPRSIISDAIDTRAMLMARVLPNLDRE